MVEVKREPWLGFLIRQVKERTEERRVDKLVRSSFLRLCELIQKEGVQSITVSLHLHEVMSHRDLVLKAGGSDKRYIAILSSGVSDSSLQIADFKVQNGNERAMVLTERTGNIFIDNTAKNQKVGHLRIYTSGQTQMGTTERMEFLREVNQAEVDQVATQELPTDRFIR